MAIIKEDRPLSLAALLGGALGSREAETRGIRQEERRASSLLEKQKQLEDMKSQRAMQVAAQKHQQELEVQQQKEALRARQGASMAKLLGGGSYSQQGQPNAMNQIQERFNGQPIPQGNQQVIQEEQPNQQQQSKEEEFGRRPWEDIEREALSSPDPLNAKELFEVKKFHSSERERLAKEERSGRQEKRDIEKDKREEEKFERTQALAEDKFKNTKQEPRMKVNLEEISEAKRKGQTARESKEKLETMYQLVKSGETNTGKVQQISNFFGLPNLLATPADEVLNKLAVGVGLSLSGGRGSEISKMWAKANPNNEMSEQALLSILPAMIKLADKDILLEDGINSFIEKYDEKGISIPLEVVQKEKKKLSSKFKEIDDEVYKDIETSYKQALKEQKSTSAAGSKVNPNVKVGALIFDSKAKAYGINRGNGKVDMLKTKPVGKDIIDADPSQFSGKVFPDPSTGKQYMSDGKQWYELEL